MGSSLHPAEAASIGIKLRESCDACLTAKVKCGKGRPLCHRCLTNGSECIYSPSARAGRKNRNSTGGVKKSGSNTVSHKRPASIDIPKNASRPGVSPPWQSHPQAYDNGVYEKNRNTHPTTPNKPNSTTNTHTQFYNTTPPLTSDDEALDMNMHIGQNGIPVMSDADSEGLRFMPTPPFQQHEFNQELSHFDGCMSASSTLSFAQDFGISPSTNNTCQTFNTDMWPGSDSFDTLQPLMHGSLESSIFDLSSPIQPELKPRTPSYTNGHPQKQQHIDTLAEGCDCFADCLQSLKDLHGSCWSKPKGLQNSPQFDVVLSVNNAAINASNKMLTCTTCSTKSGIGISTMLMATMFGKVLSLYRAAVYDRFGSATSPHDMQSAASLAFGAYEVSGDDRHLLEIEILLFELKKVEKTMSLWRDRSTSLSVDMEINTVFTALADYLDKNLRIVTEFLLGRRSEYTKDHESWSK